MPIRAGFVAIGLLVASSSQSGSGPARTRLAPTESGWLVVTNMNDNTATLIDLASHTVRATLPTGIGPHEAAASHDGRWAVVSNYGIRDKPGSTLTVIDIARASVARTIDLGRYQRPHGMAFLPGDTMLAVTSEASKAVLLVDLRSGNVAGTISTDRPVSHMLALSANGELLYTTNIVDGSITGINPKTMTTLGVIPVAKLVEGIAITPDGKQVWVGSNGDSLLVVVDAKLGRAVDTLKGFGMPYRTAITNDGKRAIISDPARAEVRVVEVATRKLVHLVRIPTEKVLPTAEFPGSPCPEGVTVSTDGNWGYVTLQGRNQVAGIELSSGKITWVLPVGAWPDGIAYVPLAR